MEGPRGGCWQLPVTGGRVLSVVFCGKLRRRQRELPRDRVAALPRLLIEPPHEPSVPRGLGLAMSGLRPGEPNQHRGAPSDVSARIGSRAATAPVWVFLLSESASTLLSRCSGRVRGRRASTSREASVVRRSCPLAEQARSLQSSQIRVPNYPDVLSVQSRTLRRPRSAQRLKMGRAVSASSALQT